MNDAFDTGEILGLSVREYHAIEKQKVINGVRYSYEQGEKAGRAKAREEARKEARKEGWEEGILEIARKLLAAGQSPDFVANVTKLPLGTVLSLQEDAQP